MNQGFGAVATRMMPWTDHGAAYWVSDFVLWGSLVVMPILFLTFMAWAGLKAADTLALAHLGGAMGAMGAGKIGAQGGAAAGIGKQVGGAANKAGGAAMRAGARAASNHPKVRAARAAATTARNLRY